jgi:hypothetical protein
MDMIEIVKSELKLVKVSSNALSIYCQQFGHVFSNNEGLYIRKITAYILACNELKWYKILKNKNGEFCGNYRCYGIGELRIYYNCDENFVYSMHKSDVRLDFNATISKLYQSYCNKLGLSNKGNNWGFTVEPVNVNGKSLQNFKDIFPEQKDFSDEILVKKISARLLAYNELKWYKETVDTRIYFIDRLRVFYNVKENTIYRLYESDKKLESNIVIKKLYYLFCDYFGMDRHNYMWIEKPESIEKGGNNNE